MNLLKKTEPSLQGARVSLEDALAYLISLVVEEVGERRTPEAAELMSVASGQLIEGAYPTSLRAPDYYGARAEFEAAVDAALDNAVNWSVPSRLNILEQTRLVLRRAQELHRLAPRVGQR